MNQERRHRLRATCVLSLGGFSSGAPERLGRFLDIAVSSLLVLVLSPWMLLQACVAWCVSGTVFARTRYFGRDGCFDKLAFARVAPGSDLACLLNVIRGDLALAGPRPVAVSELGAMSSAALLRFVTRPGLISPFRLQRSVGIAHESESVAENQYALEQSLAGDVSLLLRWIPARFVASAQPVAAAPPTVRMLGVSIDNIAMDEAVARLTSHDRQTPLRATFVNPDCLNLAYENETYHAAVSSSALVMGDGIGLQLAGRMLKTPLEANVNGTDMFPRLCERAAKEGLSLFLLGARPGIARAAAKTMTARVPGLRIAGWRDGYFEEAEEPDVVETINRSDADILLVGFGAPRQELWLEKHEARLRVPVRVGVGGLFDFYSGRIPRAPMALRELGLEWVWRLAREPQRMWRRYLVGNPLFLWRVLMQRRKGDA
ncbi:MAG: WecB/TagA/CpsF family glycosyltransferase [Acidobacteria bacterium]|nr:MAG: WecB/TagA/CpsF family glycosyltransferase [Acidobacteriota bacterium]